MSLSDACGDQPQEPDCLLTAGVRPVHNGMNGANRAARALAAAGAAGLILCSVWLTGLNKTVAGATKGTVGISVDYPLNGSMRLRVPQAGRLRSRSAMVRQPCALPRRAKG